MANALERSLGSTRLKPTNLPDECVDHRPRIHGERRAYPQIAVTYIDDAKNQQGENFQKVPQSDSAAFLRQLTESGKQQAVSR